MKKPFRATVFHKNGIIPFILQEKIISFEVKNLCKVFDFDSTIFEKNRDSNSNEIFVTEYEIFASPLVQNTSFRKWYFEEVNPVLQTFVFKYEKVELKRFIQKSIYLINKHKSDLAEKIDKLKQYNVQTVHEELCKKPIPIMTFEIFGADLPFNEKFIQFVVDWCDYTWFEISSLCDAFNVEQNIFESANKIFCLSYSFDDNFFVSELDIFTSSLADKLEFLDWYGKQAVPRITSFVENQKYENERKYFEILKQEYANLDFALREIKEKLKEHIKC